MHDSYASSQALSYAAMLCDHVFVDDAIADPDASSPHPAAVIDTSLA